MEKLIITPKEDKAVTMTIRIDKTLQDKYNELHRSTIRPGAHGAAAVDVEREIHAAGISYGSSDFFQKGTAYSFRFERHEYAVFDLAVFFGERDHLFSGTFRPVFSRKSSIEAVVTAAFIHVSTSSGAVSSVIRFFSHSGTAP